MALAAPASRALSPYHAVLGDAFFGLDPAVRRAHTAPLAAHGALDVHHGAHWSARWVIALMRLPVAGERQRVHLLVTPAGADVRWDRQIGTVRLRTRQRAKRERIVEQHGAGRVSFTLHVENGALVYRQASMSVAGVTIPGFLSPQVHARVSPACGGWHVEVIVDWRQHLVCRYAGVMAFA